MVGDDTRVQHARGTEQARNNRTRDRTKKPSGELLPLRFTSRSHHLHVAKYESTTSAFNRDDEIQKKNTDKHTDKYKYKDKDKHKDKHKNQRTLNRENQIHDKSTMVRACNVDNLKAFCIHAPQEPVVDAQHPR